MQRRHITYCLLILLASLLTLTVSPTLSIARAATIREAARGGPPPIPSNNSRRNQITPAGPGNIVEYPIPSANSLPYLIANGPDGNEWFVEFGTNKIGRITPAGQITEFPIPTANTGPAGITAGPDGNLWFTENTGNQIGRITPAGVITEFPIPTVNSFPYGITAGPDGNLWFTETQGNKIGVITPGGNIFESPLPFANSFPINITKGPDGALWFTEYTGNRIGRITLAGNIAEVAIPTPNSVPYGIASGPDGNLWFTENQGNKIGVLSLTGRIVEVPLRFANSAPASITSSYDGSLWFVEFNGNRVGRISLAGIVTEFTIPTRNSVPIGITIGTDGNFWFTERNGNKIGRYSPLMTYHGGSIMPGVVNVYAIYWEPPNLFVDPNYNRLISQYYTDVGGNRLYNMLPQYRGRNGAPASARLAGTWLDNTQADAYPMGTIFSPQAIFLEVQRAIKANHWPNGGLNNYFPVYTSFSAGSTTPFCAYHNFSTNPAIVFAHNVYPDGNYARCQISINGQPGPSPNNCLVCDSVISISAHEQFEAATDPLGTGWYYQNLAGENGDLCQTDYGPLNGQSNQIWNGHPYIIQMMWNNARSSCQLSGP